MDKSTKYSRNESNDKTLHRQKNRRHYTDINPYISEYLRSNMIQGNLLDLGCGMGYMSNAFDKIGFCVTGLDGDNQRVLKAKLKYPSINFICYKITSYLPFEDNSFDVIFSRSVFQYIDHEHIIRECKRVLKKDGHIIMLENLKNNPITRFGRATLKLTNYDFQSYPWNHFTVSEIFDIKNQFQNPSLHFFHFLSPLCYLKVFNKLYPLFFRLDQKLLAIKFMRNFAWLVLLMGKNNQ
ncbi:class I SAM-dependent methyltransferase [Sabulilitoribacter multivorans]|uniref:Class I SAM-dependent methyltransferase n=1 Tax=Flaviramulus multivorans TaxID=1304750 RepID=A0ABS9IHY9_9FLAO|nr:class I SAM-dependent methyltransferase [Flaviramulus multivorans]MCF7560367.1 class I SAM-dependent methyltransferase [Flaviramulus multivorans]